MILDTEYFCWPAARSTPSTRCRWWAAAPANASVTTGQAATFAVNATGNPTPTYQWQWNGANLTDNGRVVGSATANLTVNDANAEDAGNYTVVVTNLAGNATSTAASLTVSPPRSPRGRPVSAERRKRAGGRGTVRGRAAQPGALRDEPRRQPHRRTTAVHDDDHRRRHGPTCNCSTACARAWPRRAISPAMSTDLINWQPVPAGEITPLADDDANTGALRGERPGARRRIHLFAFTGQFAVRGGMLFSGVDAF